MHEGAMGVCQRVGWTGVCQKLAPSATCDRMFMRPINVKYALSNIRFQYGTSTPLTTAADVYEARVGVCRDFTHLGVTFCRALNIPARYVFGYLPDIDVPLSDAPMDFCAWFEAYLGGRWYTFDPRNNEHRKGRAVIGRGRDALDVAMVTTYGGPRLREMAVRADKAEDDAAGAAGAGTAPTATVDGPAHRAYEKQTR